MARRDITGQKFGRLTAIRLEKVDERWISHWRCRCECGNEKVVRLGDLTIGRTTSCGCLKREKTRERKTTHGYSRTPTYTCWCGMMTRCYNEKEIGYDNYGGRGIKVTEDWHDFANFLRDMGPKPPKMTLDRIDPEKGYEPGNCRWATQETQWVNKRNTVFLTHNGEKLPLKEWAERIGIPRRILYQRIFVYGWPVEEALARPLEYQRGGKRKNVRSLKQQARMAVKVALRSGKLKRPPTCEAEDCKETKVQAHHWSGYEPESWLDVLWFCSRHHPRHNEKLISYKGEMDTLRGWEEKTGVPKATLYARLVKARWVVSDDIFLPPQTGGMSITYHGRTQNAAAWAKELGLSRSAFSGRLARHGVCDHTFREISQPGQTSDLGGAGQKMCSK